MRIFTIIPLCFVLIGCTQRVLPPDQALVGMSDAAVRSTILSNTPIGMSQDDVEKVLGSSFRQRWGVYDCQPAGAVWQPAFSVPISSGHYYLVCNVAVVRRDAAAFDIVTVYFLFSPKSQLRDVCVRKWTDRLP